MTHAQHTLTHVGLQSQSSMSLHYIEIQPRIQAAHLLLSGDIPAISVSCNSISHTGE